MQLQLPKNKIKEALKGLPQSEVKQVPRKGIKSMISLDLEKMPKLFLQKLMSHGKLGPVQLKAIAKQLGVSTGVNYDSAVTSVRDFFVAFESMDEIDGFNVETNVNGRWYPVKLNGSMSPSFFGERFVISGVINVSSGWCYETWAAISENSFKDETGAKKSVTIRQVLSNKGYRPVTKETVERYRENQLKAEKLGEQTGKQILVHATGIVQGFWGMPVPLYIGTEDAPGKVIVEPTAELEEGNGRHNEEQVVSLPFVRVFSLSLKRYCYVDVEDVKDYVYDKTAVDKLTLPNNITNVINKVFKASNNKLFGDLIANRHGGMIILANGGPGVGKTLTAEAYAEFSGRPLYVMEVGELGVDVNSLEEKLQAVFDRVARWNAVLLLDEADIFLHKRGMDIEHNAIVGIFLRLMDYYKGLLFLTTNRAEVIDDAFNSRITLRLDYPDLDTSTRSKIWKSMLESAKLTMVSSSPFSVQVNNMDVLANLGDFNGRQIRNVVRLLKVMYENTFTLQDVKDVLQFNPNSHHRNAAPSEN
jgi:hypothetical protein